jgi:hypothetical protein
VRSTAISFSVFKKSYSDALDDDTFESTVKMDLDALNATTIYEISIEHLHGFWVLICIYT